jgi:purine-binding chemotaxis protein CheW
VVTRWVGFRVDSQFYALDILGVQEVLAAVEVEPVPGTPPAVLGVINLRGRIVAVIDLRLCLGFPAAGAAGPCCVVVAELDGEPLGLRIDGIAEICAVAEGMIRPAPAVRGHQPDPLVRGMINRGGQLITLLDARQLPRRAGLPA